MADHPMMTTNIHLHPENKIGSAPVPGMPGRFMIELGDYGVVIFGGVAELTRIAAAIAAVIGTTRVNELTVDIDAGEAERFRLECERDARGEDQ
jgi:hypothetical protein